MSVLSDVYDVLRNDSVLTAMLANGADSIYHGRDPDAGSYPVLVYSNPSDIPAITADNAERYRYVVVRIHICTTDGAYSKIYARVNADMLYLGYMRRMTNEVYDSDIKALVVDFGMIVES